MNLHLHDTATRTLRLFEPLEPGKASIYLCGLTVQGPPHIGHVRNWISFDILRRWLQHEGLQVSFVRNVTDIDDKILTKSAAADEDWWALAFRNERAVASAEQLLGCLPPSNEPRATGHVPEMIELMQRLIDAGHAYAVDGDVYFDVRSFPSYGALSGQKVDAMLPAGDSEGDERKRDPRDFALWKRHKDGEPATASWPTPWGRGRPGWHLECSAMATRYLGASFDIHGGGLDLVFPHHENELAQSKAAGDGFAQYWLHNGLVTMAGEKMSKSLGNSLLVSEIVQRWRPVEVRYYLGASHYRSNVAYSEAALADAASAYRRIERFVEAATARVDQLDIDQLVGGELAASEVPEKFASWLDDDLGVAGALGVLHDAVREANARLDAIESAAELVALVGPILAMTDVLGINPLAWAHTSSDSSSHQLAAIDALVQLALNQRAAARARKDFAAADAVRDDLAAAGVIVEDTAHGPRWTLKETTAPKEAAPPENTTVEETQ